jgi:hypothetical protein
MMTRIVALLSLLLCLPTVEVHAHDHLAGALRHRFDVRVGARHIDVSVHLTFFEAASRHEREDMDRDGDGRVSRTEVALYLKGCEASLSEAVSLEWNGRAESLIPLYPPRLDLEGNDRVGLARHSLVLHYFLATPAGLEAGQELCLRTGLWPGVRAIVSLQAHGEDSARFECPADNHAIWPATISQTDRILRFRVLSPPRLPSDPSLSKPVQSPR